MSHTVPVVIGGKSLSRWRASWLLLREAWRYVRADTELLFVPVCAFLTLMVGYMLILTAFFFSGVVSWRDEATMATPGDFLLGFVCLVFSTFVVAFTEAMVVHTVATRTTGGNATLGESIKVAARHMRPLFVWSLIAGVVGMVLRTLSERSELLGRLIAGLLGAAWNLLTLFAVPAIVLTGKSAPASMRHSVTVFRQTWGETLITGVSLGLAFLVLHIMAVLLLIGVVTVGVMSGVAVVIWVAFVAYFLWVLGALCVQYVLRTVVTTLLYLYATSTDATIDFNPELLGQMLVRQTPLAPAVS